MIRVLSLSFLLFSMLTNIYYFIELISSCSHSRAYEFYAESIRNHGAFIGKCHSLNKCSGAEYIPMGYATPSNALV